MKTTKFFALLILVICFPVFNFAQTAKTNTTTSKVPQTITTKTTTKKTTTTTKTLQKGKTTTTAKPEPANPNTQPVVIKPTIQMKPMEPGIERKTLPTNTQPNTNTNTKIGTGKNTTGGGVIDILNNKTTPNQGNNTNTTTDVTETTASSAIKEALSKGISAAIQKVAVTDGYLGNSMIKIPFPEQVSVVESTLRSFGLGSMIDNMVTSMNRSAEGAANQAGPIFLNSIKQMTVTDAVNIVSNTQPDAATQFLQRTTTESLVGAFKPAIQSALDKTLATKYWNDITGYYNKIPFVDPVNTDLPDYVTRKAITGLFYMVAQEEAKIRKDPLNQGSQIIKDVFGKFKF